MSGCHSEQSGFQTGAPKAGTEHWHKSQAPNIDTKFWKQLPEPNAAQHYQTCDPNITTSNGTKYEHQKLASIPVTNSRHQTLIPNVDAKRWYQTRVTVVYQIMVPVVDSTHQYQSLAPNVGTICLSNAGTNFWP